MYRIAVAVAAVLGALAWVACASEEVVGPGDFGEACSAEGECLGALDCTGDDICVGEIILPGTVFFPNQNQPRDELHIAVFHDRDEGTLDPLIPARAPLDALFPAPVSYPVSFELSVPAGAWVLVAYVPQQAGVTLRGQVSVEVRDSGSFTVNGIADDRVSISITGSSGIQYE